MSGSTRSDRDQIIYKTYDDRPVSREAIHRTLRDLEVRRRRRERLERLRAGALVVIAAVVLISIVAALLWFHVLTHL